MKRAWRMAVATNRRLPHSVKRAAATILSDTQQRRISAASRLRTTGTPPERPIGAKFEITHRCNLLCGFCYTDSPAATQTKGHELSDDEWLATIDAALDLGIIEAVITGGEPFLRRDLCLTTVRRLSDAGVAVIITTNGWFVDDRIAQTLARLPGVVVNISLDGAAPELHDVGRGIEGSWLRAVEALDLLLGHGVAVRVNHVVTPANHAHLDAFLDSMWLLGVRAMRITPVRPIGGSTRTGSWEVDAGHVAEVVAAFRRHHANPPNVRCFTDQEGLSDTLAKAPATLLIKPDGSVLTASELPFVYGSAIDDGLARCWDNIRELWDSPMVRSWVESALGVSDRPKDHIAYRDPDTQLAGTATPQSPRRNTSAKATLPTAVSTDLTESLRASRRQLTDRALARRYDPSPARWSGDRSGVRYVRTASGHRCVLNPMTGRVLEAVGGTTPEKAVSRLAAQYPNIDRDRLTADVLDAVSDLIERELLVPIPAAPRRRRRSLVVSAARADTNGPPAGPLDDLTRPGITAEAAE